MEYKSSQQLTWKYNSIHVITACRGKNILRTNIEYNISIFNKIIHIQSIWNKLVSLNTKPSKSDNIGNVVQSAIRAEWCGLISANYEKNDKIHHIQCTISMLYTNTIQKIPRPSLYFRVKTNDVENKYGLYSRTCVDVSSMIEGVYITI